MNIPFNRWLLPLLFLSAALSTSFDAYIIAADKGEKTSDSSSDDALKFFGENSDRCRTLVSTLYDGYFKNNRSLHEDRERGTTYLHYGRLSTIFNAVGETEFNRLFNQEPYLNSEDIEELFYGISGGAFQLQDRAENDRLKGFITDLRQFWKESKDLFEKDGKRIPVKFFDLLQKLRSLDHEHLQSKDRTEAASATMKAFTISMEKIMDQAVRESRKKWNKSNRWYDRFVLFWKPHWSRMERIVAWGNEMLEAIQHIGLADIPIDAALEKWGAQLSPQNRRTLESMIEDTPGQLQKIRSLFFKGFGRELSYTKPIQEGDIRIFLLDKNLGAISATKESSKSVNQSRKDLDALDGVMHSEWQLWHQTHWPVSEKEPVHLEIRHTQYREETAELKNSYYQLDSKIPENADYQVKAKWKVTTYYKRQVKKTKTNSKGESETYYDTEYTSDYRWEGGTFTLHATYGEVLEGEIEPEVTEDMLPEATCDYKFGWTATNAKNGAPEITWVDQNKTNWILEMSERTRNHEKPLRHFVNANINELADIIKNYPENIITEERHQAVLQRLEQMRLDLEDYQARLLQEYHLLGEEQVLERWQNDIFQHFLLRNKILNHRYKHLAYRIDHVREQIRRKVKNFEVTYQQLDLSKERQQLYKIHRQKRWTQGIGAALLSISLITGIVAYNDPAGNAWMHRNWNKAKQTIELLIPFTKNHQPPR